MKIGFFNHILIPAIAFLIVMNLWNPVVAADNSPEKQKEKSNIIENAHGQAFSFKWAFLHRERQGKVEVLDFKKNPSVSSGDSIRIFVWPLKDVFIYIYLYDSKKDLSPLFPQSTEIYKIGKPYYIPDKDGWFELDTHKGTEIFYLIASKKPLTDLERLTKEYIGAPPDKKAEAQSRVLAEIKDVRNRFRKFTTLGEIPVPITGTAREPGLKPDHLAIQVEAENFYGKTLRLEHK